MRNFIQYIVTLGNQSYVFYRPQRSWGKVIFSQASVILFTGRVCLSACWDTLLPGKETPPAHCILGDTVYKRAVCILLECTLVLIMTNFRL